MESSGGPRIKQVRMQRITKTFPGVLANDRVDIEINSGEVLALLGENGAGKTTLMKVLYGLYRPDSGQILVNGEAVTISSPRDAIALGIGMVHQHFMLVPSLTVAENVVLGLRSDRGPPPRSRHRLAAHRGAGRGIRFQSQSRSARVATIGRRATAGGDHQGAVSRR